MDTENTNSSENAATEQLPSMETDVASTDSASFNANIVSPNSNPTDTITEQHPPMNTDEFNANTGEYAENEVIRLADESYARLCNMLDCEYFHQRKYNLIFFRMFADFDAGRHIANNLNKMVASLRNDQILPDTPEP